MIYKASSTNLPRAALAAELATRGSTVDARNATVDMTGLPDWENGRGWYVNGPEINKTTFIILVNISLRYITAAVSQLTHLFVMED